MEMTNEQLYYYLKRINIKEKIDVSYRTLKKLQNNHLRYIPYENIDSINGHMSSLEHKDLFNKIIIKNRGGICFELNGLYNWLLEKLGFQVVSYAGRFISNEEEVEMRRHRVIVVTIGDKKYLTDVGVNSESFRNPMLLQEEIVQFDGKNNYKLTIDKLYGWVLWQKKPNKEWQKIYGFTEEPQLDVDFIMPTFYCDYHPTSIINKFKKVSIFTDESNITIWGNNLKFYASGRVFKQINIKSEEELREYLFKYFNIKVDYDMKNGGLDEDIN